MREDTFEQVLIIMKPDCVGRGLVGDILSRFEKKGLQIVGMKMVKLDDALLDAHYIHHKDKPFFSALKKYMRSSPVVVLVVAGINAVRAVRLLVGVTRGYEADAGTIRGDLSLSSQSNIVHASDSPENAREEIKRFFEPHELFLYQKHDFHLIYSDVE